MPHNVPKVVLPTGRTWSLPDGSLRYETVELDDPHGYANLAKHLYDSCSWMDGNGRMRFDFTLLWKTAAQYGDDFVDFFIQTQMGEIPWESFAELARTATPHRAYLLAQRTSRTREFRFGGQNFAAEHQATDPLAAFLIVVQRLWLFKGDASGSLPEEYSKEKFESLYAQISTDPEHAQMAVEFLLTAMSTRPQRAWANGSSQLVHDAVEAYTLVRA